MVFAYAFLKAAYSEGVRNPIDAVIPLVKRALTKSGTAKVDESVVQIRIKTSLGLEIPLNVIRYTFSALAAQKVLKRENHRYALVDVNFVDDQVVTLERDSREQYDRIRGKIARFLLDYDVHKFYPDEFLEEWLDESSLSFLGGANPAFSAGTRDKELNRLMYLVMEVYKDDQSFLSDLTSIALGDSLYRAIRAITEFETDPNNIPEITSRMNNVTAYFDTRFVLRVLGFGFPEHIKAAQELIGLCKSTGCGIAILRMNVSEMQRIIHRIADNMMYSGDIEGDIASYAYEHGMSPGDLIEYASSIEEKITSAGLKVADPPPLTKEVSIDELALDDQLRIDLKQATDSARVTDVDSLAAIYRARRGEPKKFLEKSDAVFITTNKGLADSSVRFFQKYFREQQLQNSVQLCMTDVVFSTRLWTKLPTSIDKVPRAQIISHIMSNLRPSGQLREEFLRQLRDFVSEGRIPEDTAVRIRLSRFVEESLALDFEAGKQNLSRAEFISVAMKVIEKQRSLQEKIRESAKEKAKALVEQELTTAFTNLKRAEAELQEKGDDIDGLKQKIADNSALITSLTIASERVRRKIAGTVRWTIRAVAVICIFWLLDLVIDGTAVVQSGLRIIGIGQSESIIAIHGAIGKLAAIILTLLTLGGLSVAGAGHRLEEKLPAIVLSFVFKD